MLLALNMKLQQFTQTRTTGCETLLSKYAVEYVKAFSLMKQTKLKINGLFNSDITKGKEASPIQCVNGFDDEPKPQDFVYIIENCFTSPLHVDRTINSLTVRVEISYFSFRHLVKLILLII